jgi:glycosyltransferase involved in cell wall biosynthesis
MPHKVLLLVNTLSTGGAERNVALLCGRIDRNRFDPEVWVLRGGGELEEPIRRAGIPIRNLDRRWAHDPWFAFHTARDIGRSDADLVHAFLPTVAAYVALARTMAALHKPAVLSLGQSYFLRSQRLLFRWYRTCFDRLIVNSASAAKLALSAGFSRCQTSIIPNGHAVELYQQPLDRLLLRKLIGVEPMDRMVITVGRLIDTKRIRDAIDATAQLAGNWPVKLVIVGDGPERAALDQQVSKLNLTGRVVFAGNRRDVANLLRIADLFVFPSESEGLPNALIEAALARLPIVACEVPGVSDVVRHEENGLLVPPRRPTTLAAAIQRVFENPAEASRLAAAAFLHAARTYSVEQWLNALYDVYGRLLKSIESRPGSPRTETRHSSAAVRK